MEHKTKIEYPGEMSQLVTDLCKLRYDVLTQFLEMLSFVLVMDGLEDKAKGKIMLGDALCSASKFIEDSAFCVKEAWKICKPFTKEN